MVSSISVGKEMRAKGSCEMFLGARFRNSFCHFHLHSIGVMSCYPNVTAMDTGKCSLPGFSRRDGVVNRSIVFAINMDWTKHLISDYGLISCT